MRVQRFLVLLILVPMFSVVAADQNKADGSIAASLVWFDGFGAYHYDDPIIYMNNVLSGKVKDPEINALLTEACAGQTTITAKDLPKIVKALDPLKNTIAIMAMDEKTMKNQQSTMLAHFKEASPPGFLTIKSFGFTTQGNFSMLQQTSDCNLLLAVPADPTILKNATNLTTGSQLSLETELLNGAKSPNWSGIAQITSVGPGGVSSLFNLPPGPWIVYLNQKNIILQCYRVMISPGISKELIADKICSPPRASFKMKDNEEKQGS